MGLHQTKTLLHSKGNHQQNKKAICWMGEDICKLYDWEGVNNQNIQGTPTTQYQKTIWLKNGQKTWINTFQKKSYGWPTGTWKDAPNH